MRLKDLFRKHHGLEQATLPEGLTQAQLEELAPDLYEDAHGKEVRVHCAGCGHNSQVIVPKKTGRLPLCPYCLRNFLETGR